MDCLFVYSPSYKNWFIKLTVNDYLKNREEYDSFGFETYGKYACQDGVCYINSNGGCNHFYGEDSIMEQRANSFPTKKVVSEEVILQATEIENRLDHMYQLTDGGHAFPNSTEGDLMKMTYALVIAMKEGK